MKTQIIAFVFLTSFFLLSCQHTEQETNGKHVSITKNTVDSNGLVVFHQNLQRNSCQRQDSLLLLEIYRQLNGREWENAWDLTMPVTKWHGVTLSEDGFVTKIDLRAYQLKGTIPKSVEKFSRLQSFKFNINKNIIADVFLPVGIYHDGAIQYAHYKINADEPLSKAPQLDKSIAYIYRAGGAEIYKTAFAEKENIIDVLPLGSKVHLLEPLQKKYENDTVDNNYYNGKMIPISIQGDTAYVFSGYLVNLPYPKKKRNYFSHYLQLLHSYNIEHGFYKTPEDTTMYLSDEISESREENFYENGIKTSYITYFEGANFAISLSRDLVNIQQAYLFFDAYSDNIFSKKLGKSFPVEPYSDKENGEEYEKRWNVKMDKNAQLKEIDFEYNDPGVVEGTLFIVTDSAIVYESGAGS